LALKINLSVFRDDVFYIALKNNALFALVISHYAMWICLVIAFFWKAIAGQVQDVLPDRLFVPSIISVSAAACSGLLSMSPVLLVEHLVKVIGQENLAIACLVIPRRL
jgi:hypothetical protein